MIEILIAMFGPLLGIIISVKILFIILEVIYIMLTETKVEVVTRRQVSITLVGDDVDKLYEILNAAQSADINDRRLFGFGTKLMSEIDSQRLMVKKLDEEDRRKALKQLLDQYEETEIVDLTHVVTPGKKGDDDVKAAEN